MRQALEHALQRVWARRGLGASLLLPLSSAYGLALALRRACYFLGLLRRQAAPVPVVVVGNVIAGGAGKTPVVMALVQHLVARGLKPGVISRGYGRSTHDCREVQAHSLADQVGDEALLVQRRCKVPVFVAVQRVQAAYALLKQYPQTDLLLCDDGLQHLALDRDLEICVFDERGTGNGWLLPAGPLREPWPRAVDLVLHTGGHPAFAGFSARRELAPFALRQDDTHVPLEALLGQPLVAVAGIAQPDNFFSMLRTRGLTLTQTIALADHFSFVDWNCSLAPGTTLVCTEKDAAKLWIHHPQALAIPLMLELEPAFLAALDEKLAAACSAKLSSGAILH